MYRQDLGLFFFFFPTSRSNTKLVRPIYYSKRPHNLFGLTVSECTGFSRHPSTLATWLCSALPWESCVVSGREIHGISRNSQVLDPFHKVFCGPSRGLSNGRIDIVVVLSMFLI